MATPGLDENYLLMQDVLRDRIRAAVPGLMAHGIDSLSQATDKDVVDPVAYVLWEGDRFPDATSNGRSVMLAQRWSVLLAVRNATQGVSAARNSDAGPLLAKLHRALAGWTPDGLNRPVRRAGGRGPIYGTNTGVYPLTFEILLTL